jgi:hypothetical protein
MEYIEGSPFAALCRSGRPCPSPSKSPLRSSTIVQSSSLHAALGRKLHQVLMPNTNLSYIIARKTKKTAGT